MENEIKQFLNKISEIEKEQILVCIDGRCGSGKTTFANRLHELLNCEVIHMDDFFLQPHQRTLERLDEAGGNIDYERFLSEVLIPLKKTGKCVYQVYDCQSQKMVNQVIVEKQKIVIIEGSYSAHPKFQPYSDLKIFMDIDRDEQIKRLEKRSADQLEMFVKKWIPMEEKYFCEFEIEAECQLVFKI